MYEPNSKKLYQYPSRDWILKKSMSKNYKLFVLVVKVLLVQYK